MKKWMSLLILCVLLIFTDAIGGCNDKNKRIENKKYLNERKFKILHIMSYHSPWEWTDNQLKGFQDGLGNVNAEFKVFQMDTKRHSDKEWLLKAANDAAALINLWKPDLIYANDDNVQKYVIKDFINSPVPVIVSGVNADPSDYGFTGFKDKLNELQVKADAVCFIGVFTFKDEKGRNVPLIEGKKPSDFSFNPTLKGIPAVSLARANKLGIKIKSDILLSSQVYENFEWEINNP